MIINSVKNENYEFTISPPIIYTVYEIDGGIIAETEYYGFQFVFGNKYDNLHQLISNDLINLYQEYALNDDVNMSYDAIELKNDLLNRFRRIYGLE